jgi:hypothetical protein
MVNKKLHGVVHKDFKNGNRHTKIYNNGYLMTKYCYPIIDQKFYSQLVNYENLHLCGGWSFEGFEDKNQCILRVLDHLKPMGEEIYYEEEILEMKEKINRVSGKEFAYKVVTNKYTVKDSVSIIIASNKKFFELFDMDSLIHDYLQYLGGLSGDFIHTLRGQLCEMSYEKVSKYLGYDFANPDSPLDLVTTGLILGYPIETTASLIIRDYEQ